MLQLEIKDSEFFDEENQTFVTIKGQTLQLEHSLVSVSKWEAKWKKPFLGKEPKSPEETVDYIRFMTITQNVNPLIYSVIASDSTLIEQVNKYIDDPMTATKFTKVEGKGMGNSGKSTTSEELYYMIAANQIPFEVQRWHLNRLMVLLRIFDEKSKPKKKMRKGETAKRYRNINAARKARLGTHG